MKAIVCDSCGKVILLPDRLYEYGEVSGVHHLICQSLDHTELDLCQESVDKLMAVVRKEDL